jgi:hypothetical protein
MTSKPDPKKRAARTTKRSTPKKPRTPAQQAADARRRKAPVRKQRVAPKAPLITVEIEESEVVTAPTEPSLLEAILDEEGELKEPSVIGEEIRNAWGRLKQRLFRAGTEPLKRAGKQATIETMTQVLHEFDGTLDGAEGKQPPAKKKEDDGIS